MYIALPCDLSANRLPLPTSHANYQVLEVLLVFLFGFPTHTHTQPQGVEWGRIGQIVLEMGSRVLNKTCQTALYCELPEVLICVCD